MDATVTRKEQPTPDLMGVFREAETNLAQRTAWMLAMLLVTMRRGV